MGDLWNKSNHKSLYLQDARDRCQEGMDNKNFLFFIVFPRIPQILSDDFTSFNFSKKGIFLNSLFCLDYLFLARCVLEVLRQMRSRKGFRFLHEKCITTGIPGITSDGI